MPTAYVLLNIKPDTETDVIEGIKTILKFVPSIKYEIQGVYGVYDIVLKIETKGMEDLRHLVAETRRIGKIQSTITMLVNEEQE